MLGNTSKKSKASEVWRRLSKQVRLRCVFKKLGREVILVFAGGVIPMLDYDYLYQAGVVAIFGPGTSVAKAACQIMEIMLED